MDQYIDNNLEVCNIGGNYTGGNTYNITLYQDIERKFIVTHNANIKPVSYFTGRETELKELRHRIEEGRKSVLVSGMGGIGKTHICRKLFEEYFNKHTNGEDIYFRHIGYIEYDGDMGSSLQNCLKFKQQDSPEQNQEAAWRELEYLASDGKLLLFIDNVDKTIDADPGLQRLKGIPGAVVLTSRQASFSDEFEPYRIDFLDMGQCVEIYEKIRFEGSGRRIDPGEAGDLEYIIEDLAGKHTITVEFLAHLAKTKIWTVKRLREELEQKGFRLVFHKGWELVNIQKSYEKLYDLSELTEAEQNILEAFSIFPYIPLAAGTCNEWLLADAGVSEDDDILMGLFQKGWLQFDMEQEGYSMHPVFAQFIYEQCKPNVENHFGLVQSCQKRLSLSRKGNSFLLACLKYIQFAEGIIANLDMKKNKIQILLMDELAFVWLQIDAYKKSEELYCKILELCKNVFGEYHSETALYYEDLAYVYGCQEDYKKGEKMYKRSVEIRESVLGKNHLDTAKSYNGLAYMYSLQNDYKNALAYFFKAYRIFYLNIELSYEKAKSIYQTMERNYREYYDDYNFKQWLEEKMKE